MSTSPTNATAPGRTLILFNRDLRLADHPALHAAAARGAVLPLFVLDPHILRDAGANRRFYLRAALEDLDANLRARGNRLWLCVGDPAMEALRIATAVGADAIHASADYSALARARERALADGAAREGIQVRHFPGVAAVAPGAVRASGGGAFQVFTPYARRWLEAPRRAPLPSPTAIAWHGVVPALELIAALASPLLDTTGRSPALPEGGETQARKRLEVWWRRGVGGYEQQRDRMDLSGTSRLSADLHFGCISAAQLLHGARARGDAAAWVRQLCWRDFYLQALADFPDLARRPFQMRSRDRDSTWRATDARLQGWRDGRTGIPIVDAAMRQLLHEGWMHNRARMLVASYLTRGLGVDWRHGRAHFDRWLVDADLAVNSGNWQWAAGTGHDRRPNRTFNLLRQALRFDPQGDYVRRYVPELRHLEGAAVHRAEAATSNAATSNAGTRSAAMREVQTSLSFEAPAPES